MLKVRVIPILTFNGFGLVKTKQFSNPRMVGNPVQTARVYNSRGVDELVFIDIFATKQKRKINLTLVKDVVKECFMPVGIGGGISSLDDINDLLKIGADKVILKTQALSNIDFIREAANFFGNQCITIAVDVKMENEKYMIHNDLGLELEAHTFIKKIEAAGAGEIIVNAVNNDGMMQGFDIALVKHCEEVSNVPLIAAGGGGNPQHYKELFSNSGIEAVGSASIFHFTQFTPLDIKNELKNIGIPVRN